MVLDDMCNTVLTLGSVPINTPHEKDLKKSSSRKSDHIFPSLTLGLSLLSSDEKTSSVSAVSSYSLSSVKKERDLSGEEAEEEKVLSSKASDDHDQDDQEGSPRKKLRLTKEQSFVLEDCFKKHSTPNPNQKQSLAEQLNLLPRQVEVWFQNRRARTKMKQNEEDYGLLKKHYEALRNENQNLQKELQELKSLNVKLPPPLFCMQFPAATLTVCPSCERGGGGQNPSKSPFSIGAC